ncbi:MAG TPA: 3-methyladenine DNA glycosylase, partial [Micromonosporaceae bacterium]|nr:3-methyladenine DNA glycosylase [Micromonosporaceae bacterium]
ALGLDGTANGLDLLDPFSPVNLQIGDEQAFLVGPRIGLTKEVERPWRFWLPNEPTVSRSRIS